MRIGARMKTAGLLIAGAALALGTVATATLAASADDTKTGKDNTNHESYWENQLKDNGYQNATCTKYEPVKTPYEVPAGSWVLLVLKAGSGENANHEIKDPVSGTVYEHPSGKDISHAILCAADSGPSATPTPSGTPSEPSETPSEPSESPSEPSETPSEPSETPSEPSETPSEPSETPSEPGETPTPPASSEPPVPTATPSELPSESPVPSETPAPTATPSAPRPGFGTGTDGGTAWPLLAGAGVIGTGVVGTGLTLLLKRLRRS